MTARLRGALENLTRRQLVLGGALGAVVLAEIVVGATSWLLFGRVTYDYLLVGAVAALTTAGVLLPLLSLWQSRNTRALTIDAARRRLAFEAGRIGLWELDLATGQLVTNDRPFEMFGRGRAASLSRTEWMSHLVAEDRPAAEAWVQGIAAETSAEPIELRAIRADGGVAFVLLAAVADRGEGGEVVRLVGVTTDVTERRQTEQRLRQSEARFRALIEQAPVAIAMSRGLRFIYANPAYLKMHGFESAEALAGTPIEERVAPEERPAFVARARTRDDGGVADTSYEATGLRADGSRLALIAAVTRLQLADGPAVVGFFQDIGEHRRAAQELAASERKLAAIYELAPLGIGVVDAATGRFLDVNPRYCEILGYPRREVLARNFTSFTHPDDHPADAEMHTRVRRGVRGALNRDKRYLRADGQAVWVSLTVVRMPGDSTHLAMVEDITARRRADEELEAHRRHLEELVATRTAELTLKNAQLAEEIVERRRAEEAADAASRAKGSFLAGMSHEIRTPMNAVLGFTQLLLRDPALSLSQRGQLEIVNRSGEHLLALLDDVLVMAKIEAGGVASDPAAFDLHALLDDLEAIFRLRAEAKGLRFLVVRSGEASRFVVTDQAKVRQALVNLLDNAVKFTERGGVTLRIAVIGAPPGGLRLAVEVEDTGPGISDAEQPRLFRHFEQSVSGRASGTGTGLGLAISRELARLMGGDVTVRSQVGVGSLFRLEVPLEPAVTSGHEAAATPSSAPRARPSQQPATPSAALPAALIAALRRALELADLEALLEAIAVVATHDAPFARLLRESADRFDYPAIGAALDARTGPPSPV